MLKKLVTICVLFIMIISTMSCSGTATFNISTNDANDVNMNSYADAVINESLSEQIKNATPVTDYPRNAAYDDFDVIKFGIDENHNDVEWIVLKKNDHDALLLSKLQWDFEVKNILNDDKFRWAESPLRQYLNEVIINNILSKEEQKCLLKTNTDVTDEDGNIFPSVDKIFILSEADMQEFFGTFTDVLDDLDVTGLTLLRDPSVSRLYPHVKYLWSRWVELSEDGTYVDEQQCLDESDIYELEKWREEGYQIQLYSTEEDRILTADWEVNSSPPTQERWSEINETHVEGAGSRWEFTPYREIRWLPDEPVSAIKILQSGKFLYHPVVEPYSTVRSYRIAMRVRWN